MFDKLIGQGSLKVRLLLAPVFSLMCFVLLGVMALHFIDTNLRENKERQLMAVVEVANTLLQRYHAMETSGSLTREAAQKEALSSLKAMRYSGTEYLWVNDMG